MLPLIVSTFCISLFGYMSPSSLDIVDTVVSLQIYIEIKSITAVSTISKMENGKKIKYVSSRHLPFA